MIYKAEIGDFLYIIIFAVLMLLGGLEKVMKAKRQQNMPPRPPKPYDDFEDVEDPSSQRQAPPQTLEEMMRRMMQTVETQGRTEEPFYPEEAQSLEVIPDTPYFHYQPVVNPIIDQAEKEAFALDTIEDGKKASESRNFEFDIRQAVIANEILNRKY